MHIKNLTNSPYSLFNAKGESVMLPARGEIDIDPHPMHATYYRQAGYFEITETSSKPDAPEEDPRDALRDEYEELTGESADRRWSESRLRTEIQNIQEA